MEGEYRTYCARDLRSSASFEVSMQNSTAAGEEERLRNQSLSGHGHSLEGQHIEKDVPVGPGRFPFSVGLTKTVMELGK